MEEKKGFIRTFGNKLVSSGKAMGQQTVYSALLMFHAFRRKDLPCYARGIVVGAMAYLLNPFDGIPDLSPLLGYTDDLGVLSFGLVSIAAHINDEIRIKARQGVQRVFKTVDLTALQTVDAKL